jgi:hypothetical protein
VTKIRRMPLFACSCVLIAASGRDPARRDSKPTPKPKPKPTAKAKRKAVSTVADDFFDSYLRWREASEDLRTAYAEWGSCEPSQRIFRFEAYRAALDREERAASVHSHLAERLHVSAG